SFGCKEGYGVVSPVISEWLAGLRVDAYDLVFVELVHGHQFYGGHAQFFQVGNLFRQTPVGSGMLHAGTGMHGKTTNMRFINHGFQPWMPERPVVMPVKMFVSEYTFWHGSGII